MSSLLRAGRATVLLTAAAVALAFPAGAAQAQTRDVVFLAGPKDHGAPGRHEYEKDLRALATSLERSTNLAGLTTKVIVGRVPRDLAVFSNAAVIVINSSSDRDARETHPLFPPDPSTNHTGYDAETNAWLKSLDTLIKKNRIGVVVLHYSSWVENWAARGYYMDWTGGLWVQMVSKNPNEQWSIALANQTHPVLRGVKPWTYRDEIFSSYFLPNDTRRTDLLIGTPSRATIGPQTVSWAFQRTDGGRGFVFGGVDYHDNMRLEDYRRFLLNGIVWAAGIDVPAGGVQSPTLDIK